jgi:hypothetical protein
VAHADELHYTSSAGTAGSVTHVLRHPKSELAGERIVTTSALRSKHILSWITRVMWMLSTTRRLLCLRMGQECRAKDPILNFKLIVCYVQL